MSHVPEIFTGADAPTVTLPWVCRQLGVPATHGLRRRCAYLELLILDHRFPPPLPTLVGVRTSTRIAAIRELRPAARLTTAVVAGSRWRRDAVEAWLSDFHPPATAAQIDAAAMRAAAAEMDASAGNLRLVTNTASSSAAVGRKGFASSRAAALGGRA